MAEPGRPGGRWGPGRGRAREARHGISPAILPHPPPLARARASPSYGAGPGRGWREESGNTPGRSPLARRAPAHSGARRLSPPHPLQGAVFCENCSCSISGQGSATCSTERTSRTSLLGSVPLLGHLLRDAPQRKARPLHTLNPHFRARWLRSPTLSCSSRPQLQLTAKDLRRALLEQPLQSPPLPLQSPRELRNLPATRRKKVILRAFSL